MTSRVGALVSSVLLVLGVSVAVAAPAQAAGQTTVSFDASSGLHLVDARAQPSTVSVGWASWNSSVYFRSTAGISSWPTNCQSVNEPALGQYVYCPGNTVAGVAGFFGSGPDVMRVEGVCMDYVGAMLGDGSDEFTYLDCPSASSEVLGEGGDDWIRTGDGPDEIDGGPGNDDIRAQGGDDKLIGGDGNDKLDAGSGNDTISGGAANDVIYPGPGNDVANGDDGDDTLASQQGEGGADTGADDLRGGPGTDTLDMGNHVPGATIALDDVANDGNSGEGDNYHSDFERILGTSGADNIVGTNNPDYIKAGTGNDTIQGLGGNDEIDGDSDNDVIDGGAGNDILYGGYGNDDVTGGAGIDSLYGDYTACSAYGCPAGSDILRSVDGEVDTINCGSGADQAFVDTIDVLGSDGFQVCEAITRTGPVPPSSEGGVEAGRASRAKGVKITLTCAAACTATAQVVVSKKVQKALKLKSRVLGTTRTSMKKAGTVSVKVSIAKWAQQQLRKKGTVKATVSVRLTGGATLTDAIKLKP